MKMLKIKTNKRELIVSENDIKTQSRAGKGVNIFNLANTKILNGEEILYIEPVNNN